MIQHSFYFLLLTQSTICVKEKYTVCSLGTLEAPTGLHYEFKIKARWRVDLRHVAPSRFVHDKTHIAHSNSTNIYTDKKFAFQFVLVYIIHTLLPKTSDFFQSDDEYFWSPDHSLSARMPEKKQGIPANLVFVCTVNNPAAPGRVRWMINTF